MTEQGMSYRQAGVDIEEAERSVGLISSLIKSTHRSGVVSDIGGFAGLFKLDLERYPQPILLSGTDGVGSKLKVAQMMNVHDTVGIDLVAMCVNDILVNGAEPLFFLDYLAVGKLIPEQVADLVRGVAEGCRQAGCALIGGETAEMPDFYGENEYDMAGFAVGVVNQDAIIDGKKVAEGDIILGLGSSGLHSNGYSLARKIVFDRAGLAAGDLLFGDRTAGEVMLTPTRIYVKSILHLLNQVEIKAMAHITGGGIPGNLSRVIPPGFEAHIDTSAWKVPEIFGFLAEKGPVERMEMFRTFNMGIGFIIIVAPEEADLAEKELLSRGEVPYRIGTIGAGEGGIILK